MSRGHRSRCHLPLVIELTCIVAGATAALRLFGSRERSRASSTSSGYASSTHPCQRQSVVIALGIEALIPSGFLADVGGLENTLSEIEAIHLHSSKIISSVVDASLYLRCICHPRVQESSSKGFHAFSDGEKSLIIPRFPSAMNLMLGDSCYTYRSISNVSHAAGRHGVSHKVESTIESGGSYEIPMDGKAIHSFR
ncbi:hypothetical protein COCSADRAFT_356592 [Bipolaris sorokiniana ND90Pr]|uniref:Uncharacterized protein n=1 Tax=Cochliobolus sativus (strain ND90Pr / ATCC 201652) TaxID=665912 RepID=M2T7M0_COCSN|nr:uncharacterized protein COCSADRAFT_356592 [Bipolaris sorokiniana ND90Pr]EMD65221.1 hypothetical protein COCSADRAFT_356592 [Bipolaris sorokiniana ND90Pr]